MKVCIIGWYGTETIGDRGILAGIISILNQTYSGNFSILLGSLYPYFTERTLIEDNSFYTSVTGKHLNISLFNSKKSNELEDAIVKSDLVLVGGGPLMHINAMFMIEYAFKFARKINKKTCIFGCGIGPLHKKRHQKSTLEIVKSSDVTILRDSASARQLGELSENQNNSEIFVSLDPSVQCLLDFISTEIKQEYEQYIAVNLRTFPDEYSREPIAKVVNDKLTDFIKILTEKSGESKIKLIPMHYFHIGNDDRDFLNTVYLKNIHKNIEVQNVNLSLKETLSVFRNATFCVGMRFHSVVFQTILNGKNIILDYTEPEKGKIFGFLSDIGGNSYYEDKYFNLQNTTQILDDGKMIEAVKAALPFESDKVKLNQKLEIYSLALKKLF